MFMQLTSRASLRDRVDSLKARSSSLYHVGIRPVARSTFADAKNKFPAYFYEKVFITVYQRCAPVAPKHTFNPDYAAR
jgi:putative transposase